MVGRLTLDQEVGVRIPAPQLDRKPRYGGVSCFRDGHRFGGVVNGLVNIGKTLPAGPPNEELGGTAMRSCVEEFASA
jgi:hypothetical protein